MLGGVDMPVGARGLIFCLEPDPVQVGTFQSTPREAGRIGLVGPPKEGNSESVGLRNPPTLSILWA